jgi:hypothetical protein
MSNFNAELSLLCLIEQEDTSSTEYGCTIGGVANVSQFVASGGAADGSTVLSTDIGAAYVCVASDAIGCRLKCISSSSRNVGEERKIVAFAEAPAGTGAFTVERFTAQVVATDVFVIVRPPNPYIGVDTGAAPTFADSDRAVEADNYWNGTAAAGGPYLEHVNSALNTETTVRLVTDFANIGGVFTAASGANATVGDLAEIWCCPEEMSGTLFDCTIEPLKRGQTIGRFEPQPDVKGMHVASANLEFAFRGPGAATPSGRTEISRMLGSPLSEQVATGDLTAGAGGTTASVAFGAGACTDGHLYLTSRGDVFAATSGAATPAVPSPSLRTAEVDGNTIVELKTYWPGTSYNHLLSAKQFRGDGIKEEISAIAPDWSFEGKVGDFLRCKAACSGGHWYRVHTDESGELTRKWRAKRPGSTPVMLGLGRVVYLGVEMCLESFSLALNQKPARKGCIGAPNHEAGWDLVRGTPTGQMVAKVASNNIRWIEDHLTDYDNFGTAAANGFLIQCGSRAGYPGVFAFWSQAIQITNWAPSAGEGLVTVTADFQVVDHDTDTTLMPPWALGIG